MTRLIEMDTAGGKQQTRVFSLRGAHLLGMFARTEKAKAFRKWVLDILDREVAKSEIQSVPEKKTKQTIPGGLTGDQCDAVKALVKARAEALPHDKRAKATIEMWSAVKSKFGKTYKAVSPEEYVNVVSLIARVPLEGEFIPAGTPEPTRLEAPTPTPVPASSVHNQTFSINRSEDWHTNFLQGQEAVNVIRQSVCTGEAKLLDKVKYAMKNAQARIYQVDFCSDGTSVGYIDMITRYAIVGMQACHTPLTANLI